ncbi:MAG: hypothetical protein FJX76_14470 [Armatimonadetes bacterium]|nr:hypothetical protein [Armatimonadota bacterium]
MDGIRGSMDQSLNPMSSKFHSTAIQNMQTNIASVKDNKDLKDDGADEPGDKLSIAFFEKREVHEGRAAESARNSGELAEMFDDMQTDDEEKVEGGRRRMEAERDAEIHGELGMAAHQTVNGSAPGAATDGQDIGISEAQLDSEQIQRLRADVPDEIYSAATQFVQGQMINDTRPANSLTRLKSIPEPGVIETTPEDFHGMLDIHDTHNQPLPMEMEEVPA